MGTSVNDEFRVFLQTENSQRGGQEESLSDEIPMTVFLYMKRKDGFLFTHAGSIGVTFFYSTGICTKQQVVRLLEDKTPTFFISQNC